MPVMSSLFESARVPCPSPRRHYLTRNATFLDDYWQCGSPAYLFHGIRDSLCSEIGLGYEQWINYDRL